MIQQSILHVSRYMKKTSSVGCFHLKTLTTNMHTLSRLATAFNNAAQNTASRNIIDSIDNVGLFGVPQLNISSGFNVLKEQLLTSVDVLVDDAISASPSPDVVGIFDNLSNEICKVADLAEFIRLAHPDESYAKAAESTSFEIGGLVEKLNTHHKLYTALRNSQDQSGEKMDSVTRTVGDLFLVDFEQSGIHLPKELRKKAVQLHEAILVLGAQFIQGASLPREYPVNKWPKDVKIVHQMTNRSTIKVDSTFSDSGNPRLREQCYIAYMSSCDQQLELLENLLYCRGYLSSITGFESYAHRSLRSTMASNPDNVTCFLDRTLSMLQKPLQKELDVIMKYRKNFESHVNTDKLKPWDIRYYTSLIEKQTYNINSQRTSEYFSVGACMHGLNIIFSSLYGVSLNVVECSPGEVWSADVQKLEVCDEDDGVLGYIYCDFYQRHGKLLQDSHFTIRGGKLLDDGSYQTPIVCLMCNFPSPRLGKPSLLNQSMVENLFHEMGHAMHSMLGRGRYQHVTGTRCSTDFAEVPSILMEYFSRDPRIISLFAKHYKTGESLPEDIIHSMASSRKLFSAVDIEVQSFYSIVDQKFHSKHPLGKSSTDLLDDLHKQYSPMGHNVGTAWHLRFSHFHTYGAKYYSYVWSKAVAASVWYNCFERDPLSRCAGDSYRNKMLKHGGAKAPQEMVDDILGRKITTDDLVGSLQYDLDF